MRLITCLCLALCLAFGCKKKTSPIDENKQILRVNIHTEPPTLDARKATDTSSISVIHMCFEGLLKRGKGGEVQSAIAQDVKISEDKKVYTFTLRPAKWWDGKPVTAQDFELTWKTVLDPNFPSGFANDLYVIKNGHQAKMGLVPLNEVGVKALDAKTLQVELEYPIPYFLDLVASHSFLAVPHHITSVYPNWADGSGSLFVGNGPYKLTKWRHHNFIRLEKNDLYWDKETVSLQEIDMSIIEDPTTELNMFEAGELDWAGYPLSNLPTDALQALASTGRLNTLPISGTYYYAFNVKVAPFNNVNFRKAFSLAINRMTIIENITQSNQAPATGLIPPTIWKVDTHFQDNDVQEARRLFALAMKEMGYTPETMPRITLIYNTCENHHKIAQAIQEQWFQAFGIRVKLANKEWKVFLDELSHGQFQVARMGGVAGFNDAMTFFDQYKYLNHSNNFTGWSNPKFTELLETAERTANAEEREKMMREAEKILISEMPIAPIYYYTGTYVKKNYVKGIELTEFNHGDYKFAFLETQ